MLKDYILLHNAKNAQMISMSAPANRMAGNLLTPLPFA